MNNNNNNNNTGTTTNNTAPMMNGQHPQQQQKLQHRFIQPAVRSPYEQHSGMNLLQASAWDGASFGSSIEDYAFAASMLSPNPHSMLDVPSSFAAPPSPLGKKMPELMPKGKLSIDTAIHRAVTMPTLQVTPRTPLTGMAVGGNGHQGAASATPTTPTRRRTNYTTNDMGPAFGPTKQLVQVLSMDRSKTIQFGLMSRIDKGFFLVGDEWTCYRRNYFQVSGSFGLSYSTKMPTPMDDPPSLMSNSGAASGEDGLIEWEDRQRPILCYKMGVLARVAASEKEITLVQHTTKRDKGPQDSPAPKPITVSHRNGLAGTMGVVDFVSNQVVTYERLQFKAATANNGKRRAAQQYFVVDVVLYAEVEGDHGMPVLVKLATSSSCSLVVRGRSPGHYTDGGALISATMDVSPYPLFSPGSGFSSMSGRSLTANAFVTSPKSGNMFESGSNAFPTGGFDPLSLAPISAYGALGSLSQISLNSPFGDGSSLNLGSFDQEQSFQNNFPFGGEASLNLQGSSPFPSQNGFDGSMAVPSIALPGYDQTQSFLGQAPTNKMFNDHFAEGAQNDNSSAATLMAVPQPMLASNSMASSRSSLRSDESIESALHLS